MKSLGKLQRDHRCQPADTEAAAAYIHILERRVAQPVLGTISLQQIQEETCVSVLRHQIELAEKVSKAGWNRIKEIQAGCRHEFGEPMYGEYISRTCQKCGHDEWY